MRRITLPGTYRIRSPQETLQMIKPVLGDFGITRLADVTGLDVIGIQVVMAARPLAADLIDPDLQSQEAVRPAFRYKDEIIGQDGRVSVQDLRPDVIIHHLAGSWNLDPGDRPALIAAARDRGFTSPHQHGPGGPVLLPVEQDGHRT